jgi:tetratricopeptide (TPR) repeat protein
MNDFVIDGDTAFAVVFEKKEYINNNRPYSESQWYTYTLMEIDKEWIITETKERNYLQADFTELEVLIDPDKGKMIAKANIDISILQGGEDNVLFWLNRGLTINTIADETGKELKFSRNGLEVLIPLKYTLKGKEKLNLIFSYSGTLFNEYAEQKYCLAYLGKEGCFANFVTQWYPKLNGTLTKSKAKLTYKVPKHLTVASVGVLSDKKEEGELTTYTYHVNVPMDYTFNANKFTSFYKNVNDVSINVFLFNSNSKKAEMYADNAAQMVSFLSDFYGIFPFDSYSISEVPSSITNDLGGAGGQGMNFYPETALRDTVFEFPLLAHEIGHMWWGSWVTGKENSGSLFDEGFAQFSSVICYRHFYGERAMWKFLNDGATRYSQSAKLYFERYSNNDIPLGKFDVNRNSDITMLARVKAHFVYAMLMENIGYYSFDKGIKRVVSEYANKRMGLDDFKKIMEEESGMNLDVFFEQWFFRTGAPEFAIEYTVKETNDGKYMIEGLVTQKREIYDVNAEIELSYDDYREVEKLKINKKETPFSYVTDRKPHLIIFDPDRKILRWSEETKYLPLLGKGLMSSIQGRNEEAVDTLTKYLEHKPYDMKANGLLGIALVNNKQYDKALKHLLLAEKEYSKGEGDKVHKMFLYLALGEYYFETENQEKAKIYFEEVLLMSDIMSAHAKAHSYLKKIK